MALETEHAAEFFRAPSQVRLGKLDPRRHRCQCVVSASEIRASARCTSSTQASFTSPCLGRSARVLAQASGRHHDPGTMRRGRVGHGAHASREQDFPFRSRKRQRAGEFPIWRTRIWKRLSLCVCVFFTLLDLFKNCVSNTCCMIQLTHLHLWTVPRGTWKVHGAGSQHAHRRGAQTSAKALIWLSMESRVISVGRHIFSCGCWVPPEQEAF